MKIVILDGSTENPGDLSWSGFEQLGELTVYDRTPPELVVERIADAEIVYTNKTPLTREVIEAAPSILFIGVLSTGYNVVDTLAAREYGIPVSNVPSYGTAAVAQMVFALILEIAHHVGHHSDAVHAGRWTTSIDYCFWDYPLIELSGKTMGIVGYGRIGKATADIARAFGMDVIAYDALVQDEAVVPLDELLARSDIISLHCPLLPETTGLIDAAAIAKMKDSVIVINTSRGPLVNEADMRAALESGKVYAFGCDVVSVEPIRADNPLLGAPNCIITPHIAWAPKASRQRLMDVAVGNLAAFLNGNAINVVN
ncbi:glycerate dehydrogenase [Clostridia bacterium]|nr:glycerate dehydrogenase [Clostridia bacterium]